MNAVMLFELVGWTALVLVMAICLALPVLVVYLNRDRIRSWS